jgi:hypothetical protein
MDQLQAALKWLALAQQIIAAGSGPWNQIKAVLAAHGIEADTAALDEAIADAGRRKAQAEADAKG